MRRLAALLLFTVSGTALAAACQPAGDGIVLNIQDFGTAYFQDFTLDPARNAAEFRNGVCLHAPDESWTVNAASIDITGLQPGMPIAVSASDATLSLDSWTMTARELSSDGRIFEINGGTFTSDGMTGTVSRVVFDLETGEIDGTDIVRASDLPPIVGNMAPGTRVELEVFREGRTRNFTVTLASLDSATGASQAARPGGRGPAPGAAQSSNPLGLAEGEGVRITAVDGQAARSAGIRPGDVISRVGRSVVGSAADLDRLLRNVQSGQTVMLLRHRGGATEFVAVTLEADD